MPGCVVPAVTGTMASSDFSEGIEFGFVLSTYTDSYTGCGAGDLRRSPLFRPLLSQHSDSLTPEDSSGLHFQILHPFYCLRPIMRGSASPVIRLRRCRIHFMLRTVDSHVLLELISSLRHIRSPDASEDSYPTLWRLSGPDFHRQVKASFQSGP